MFTTTCLHRTYLKDKFPPNSRALFSANIRNTFREIICKSNRYKYNFFPDAISPWNTFIKHFDNVPTFDILRKHIITFFRPQMKSIFGIHDPVGLRYLFQLRVGLSPLRSHKWRHNFSDTPHQKHVLVIKKWRVRVTISCPFFATQRATLAISVMHILQHNNLTHSTGETQLYLYGHRSLYSLDNKKILLATIQYVKDSRRFSNLS